MQAQQPTAQNPRLPRQMTHLAALNSTGAPQLAWTLTEVRRPARGAAGPLEKGWWCGTPLKVTRLRATAAHAVDRAGACCLQGPRGWESVVSRRTAACIQQGTLPHCMLAIKLCTAKPWGWGLARRQLRASMVVLWHRSAHLPLLARTGEGSAHRCAL